VDEDGDTITVTSTRELEEAGRVADLQKLTLKLFVTTKNAPHPSSNIKAENIVDEDEGLTVSSPAATGPSSRNSKSSDAATSTPTPMSIDDHEDGDEFHIVNEGDIQHVNDSPTIKAPIPITISDDSNVDAKVWAGYFDFTSGRTYWYNKKTGITTWNTPTGEPSRDDSQIESSPKKPVAWIHPMKGTNSNLLDQIRMGKMLRKASKRGCRGHGGRGGGPRWGKNKKGKHCHGGRGHPWGHHRRCGGRGHEQRHQRKLRQQLNAEIVGAAAASKKQSSVGDDDEKEVSWDRVHLLALQLLGSPAARNNISEIKTVLASAPQLVKDSLHATAILFDMEDPSTFKTMKQLLNKKSFSFQGLFQCMVRLDPASLTKEKLDSLAPLLTCTPEDSKKVTVAIEPLYRWLHAVYTYGVQKHGKSAQALSPRQSLLKEIQGKDFNLKRVTANPQGKSMNLVDELHKMKIVHESHTQKALTQARRQLRQEVRSMQGELSAKRCLLRELRSSVNEKQPYNGGKGKGRGGHGAGRGNGGNRKHKPTHLNIQCDGCGVLHIPNNRFKCVICPDFDLCGQCERSGMHDPSHPMLKMKVHVEDFTISFQPKVECAQVPPLPVLPAEGPILAAGPLTPPPPPPKPMKLPGDQLPMATIIALPPFQYTAQLQSVKDMGFKDNEATVKSLLLEHKGNVQSVVEELLA